MSFRIARVGGKIDIGELATEIVLDVAVLRAVSAKSQSTQQAQDHVAILILAQGVQDAVAFCVEIFLEIAVLYPFWITSIARSNYPDTSKCPLTLPPSRLMMAAFMMPSAYSLPALIAQRAPDAHMTGDS